MLTEISYLEDELKTARQYPNIASGNIVEVLDEYKAAIRAGQTSLPSPNAFSFFLVQYSMGPPSL